MSWSVVVLPDVYDDLTAASDWYEGKLAGLGARFTEEVLQVWASLAINPLLNSKKQPGRNIRWRYPKKFPYKVVYSVEENTKSVVVVAVIHAARHEKALTQRHRARIWV